jgi:hypothetical protein
MMHKLEKLRTKPDHIKRMIAFGVSGGITLVIFAFWVVSLSISAGGSNENSNTYASSAGIAQSPLSALSASVADAFAPVGATFLNLFSLFSNQPASSSNAIQLYAVNSASATEMNNQ